MKDNGDRDTSMKTPTSTEQANWGNDTESLSGHAGGPTNKEMRSYNPDTPDNMFMEEVSGAALLLSTNWADLPFAR